MTNFQNRSMEIWINNSASRVDVLHVNATMNNPVVIHKFGHDSDQAIDSFANPVFQGEVIVIVGRSRYAN